MSITLTSAERRLAMQSLASRPTPGADPGFMEAAGAAWEEMRRFHNWEAEFENRVAVVDSHIDRYEAATGTRLLNPEWFEKSIFRDRAKGYEELRGKFADAGLSFPDDDGLQQEAMDRARQSRERAALTRERSTSWGSFWGDLAGSMGGALTDPINVSSMAFGAGWSSGILRTALIEAGIVGASQTAIEIGTWGYKRQVDPTWGAGDAAANIVTAGAAGGAFGAGIKTVAAAWRAARARLGTQGESLAGLEAPPATETPVGPEAAPARPEPAPEPEIQQSFPRDVLDAGAVVEREAEAVASNPHRGAGLAGEAAHKQRLAEAEDAIATNRPPEIPDDDLSRGTWRPGRVATPDGRKVEVQYQVVEADDLIPSHRDDLSVNPDYPAALQPRDRTRAASADQITAMASRLDPERLGPSPDAASGAPIVGPDGVVESGNARVLAIRRAGSPEYRAMLADMGFDVGAMQNPVLIARRVTSMTEAERADFALAANRATAARMSAAETAVADARALTDRVMSLLRDPDVSLASNRDFRRAFVDSLPESERGGLVDRRGAISKEGLARIEAAMLARAYGDAALLGRMLEDTDNNIKAIGGALMDASGAWAKMRDAVSHGTVAAPMDITDDLIAALRIVQRARDEGQKVADIANQADFFERPTPVTRALLGFMFRGEDLTRPTGRPAMASMLAAYADEALKNTAGPRLLGDELGAGDVLATALAKAGREDLIPMARDATSPEAIDLALAKPERIDDTALVEAQRILGERKGASVKITDAETGAEVTRKVDDLFREADDEIAAARDLEACATGGIVGATAA